MTTVMSTYSETTAQHLQGFLWSFDTLPASYSLMFNQLCDFNLKIAHSVLCVNTKGSLFSISMWYDRLKVMWSPLDCMLCHQNYCTGHDLSRLLSSNRHLYLVMSQRFKRDRESPCMCVLLHLMQWVTLRNLGMPFFRRMWFFMHVDWSLYNLASSLTTYTELLIFWLCQHPQQCFVYIACLFNKWIHICFKKSLCADEASPTLFHYLWKQAKYKRAVIS